MSLRYIDSNGTEHKIAGLNNSSNEFLPITGGTLTGELNLSKTSYNYSGGAIPGTKLVGHHTVENLVEELRFSNGQFGSVLLQTIYTKDGIVIPNGWYNYQYIPHRCGGENGGVPSASTDTDNVEFGTLILYGMTVNHGITYKLTIVNGTVAYLTSPEIYSTTEQIVGRWVDGSFIYRTVLIGTPSSQLSNVNHGISNLATPIKCYGFYKRNSDGCLEPMPGNYTNWECWMYDFNSTKFTLRFSNNAWNSGIASYVIIIEYVKTS